MDIEIQQILEQCNNTRYLGIFEYKKLQLDHSKPTLIVLTGPTGSGKSTFIKTLAEKYPRIQTATTREKRPEEEVNSYTWINDKILDGETIEEYQKRLNEKYDLIESDFHEANLYGIPRQNILNALKTNKVSLIGIERNGVLTLKDLLEGKCNLICIFVLPDSINQLIKRIEEDRNDLQIRIDFAKEEISTSTSIANYYIHNTETNIYSGSENPLHFMKKNLVEFISDILSATSLTSED